ncbi:MAG TPA: hypothetical protein DCQ17_04115 [Firmicutes bacterium]|nr:hypothetical protein [Bacillota bacterium]
MAQKQLLGTGPHPQQVFQGFPGPYLHFQHRQAEVAGAQYIDYPQKAHEPRGHQPAHRDFPAQELPHGTHHRKSHQGDGQHMHELHAPELLHLHQKLRPAQGAHHE